MRNDTYTQFTLVNVTKCKKQVDIVKLTFILLLNSKIDYITYYIYPSINLKCNKVMYGNHFSFQELVHTDTDLVNVVGCDEHLANLARLWNTLNFIRERYGAPIIVNSAYRTNSINKQVGGRKRSLHTQGRAADIRPKDSTKLGELWKLLYSERWKYAELIKYETFIHIAI